jgi:hypothetical protein
MRAATARGYLKRALPAVAFRTNRHARLFGIILRSAKATERSGAGTAGPCLHRGPAPSSAHSGGGGAAGYSIAGLNSRKGMAWTGWKGGNRRVYDRRPSGSQRGSGAGIRAASPAQSGNAGMLMRRQPGNAHGISFVPLSVLGRALVLYIDDGPGDRINERGTADQAILAAWTREFRRVSGRCDFASVTVDVDCLPRFHSPSPLSRKCENKQWRGNVPW